MNLARGQIQRDQGSWGREGSDLSCKGKIIVDEREIPARLISWRSSLQQ